MKRCRKKLYAANAAKFKEKLSTGGFGQAGEGKLQILAELMRLRQICCDPRLCYDNYRGSSAKLGDCMDLGAKGWWREDIRYYCFPSFTSIAGYYSYTV